MTSHFVNTDMIKSTDSDSDMDTMAYYSPPSSLDGVEHARDYRSGGFHPIAIGDAFSQGRYSIVHKLGYGGSSTVWLARDREGEVPLVALKALRAEDSSGHTDEICSLSIPKLLRTALPTHACIQTVSDHFFVQGPNGTHLFIISPLAGPNVLAMLDCPGRTKGCRRLRADLARKVAKQVAMTIYHMHCAGVVHGGEMSTYITLYGC